MKEKAIELRAQGLTYKEISSALDGAISIDWCKRNLKGVEKKKMTDACIEELVRKATRPEGLSVYEANAIIFKHNAGNKVTADETKNIRKKATYANPDCLFRPAWMDAKNPIQSYKTMMAFTDHMLDELDYVVRQYCDIHPTVNPSAVKYEVMKYMYPKISKEPLAGRIMRTEVLAERLSLRNVVDIDKGDELEYDTEDRVYTDVDLNIRDIDEGLVSEDELDAIWS